MNGKKLTALAIAAVAIFSACLPARAEGQECVVTRATYTGTVSGESIDLTLTLNISLFDDRWADIVLPPGNYIVNMERTTQNDREFLVNDGTRMKLMLYGKGRHEITVAALLTARSEGLVKRVAIPRISALVSQITLTFAGGEHEVIAEGEETLERRHESGATTLSGRIRGNGTLAIRWYLKNDVEKIPAAVDIVQKIAYYADSGSLIGHAELSVSAKNTRVGELVIPLPRAVVATKVEGEKVDRWREENGTLHISFLTEITSRTTLHIKFESLIDNLPTTLALAPLKVQGATSITGVIAVGGNKEIALSVEGGGKLERLEIASLHDNVFAQTPNLQYAFAFRSAEDGAGLGVKRKVSRITSLTSAAYAVERELVTGRWILQLRVENAPLSKIRLKKSGDPAILGVQGEGMKGWREEGDALLIDLKYGMTGAINVIVDFQFPIDIDREFVMPFLALPDAVKEEGNIVITHAEGIEIKPSNIDGLRQTSPASGSAQTYAFSHGGWRMTAAVGEIKPRIDIAATSLFTIENDRILLRETLIYRVGRAPIFSALLTAPEGFVPTDIAGKSINGWRFDPATRRITVDFASAFKGEDAIVCAMERRLGNREERVELAGTAPSPAETFNGTVSIVAAEEFLPRAEDLVGIIEGDTTYAARQADWKMAVILTRKEPSIEASLLSKIAVERGDITVENFIRYTVAHSTVRSFSIALPAGAVNVEVFGEDILASETIKGIVRVTLRKPVKGTCALRLLYQQPLGAGGRFALSAIRLGGVDSQRGFIAISGEKNGIDTKATAGGGMNGVTRKDLPDEWRALVDPGAPFLFSYGRDPATLDLDIAEHAARKVVGARIISSDLITFLQEDGTLIHDMTALVINDAGQTMSVSLGKEATLWGAYIFGTPVKPTIAANGDVIVPISRSVTGAMAFELRLVWIERKAEDINGLLALAIPKTDIRIEAGRWKLYVPRGYSITSDQGSMKLVYASPSLTPPSFVVAVAEPLWEVLRSSWVALPRPVRIAAVVLPPIAIVVVVSILLLRRIARRRRTLLLYATGSAAALLLIGVVVWELGMSDRDAPPSVRNHTMSAKKSSPSPHEEQPILDDVTESSDSNDVGKMRYEANRRAQSQLLKYSKKVRDGDKELARIQDRLKEEEDGFEQEEKRKIDVGREVGAKSQTPTPMPKPAVLPKEVGGIYKQSNGYSQSVIFSGGSTRDIFVTARVEGALPLAVKFREASDNFCQFENDFTGGGSVGFSLSLVSHKTSFAIQIAIVAVTALIIIVLPRYSRLPALILAGAIIVASLAVMVAGGASAVPYATSALASAALCGLILAVPALIDPFFKKGAEPC